MARRTREQKYPNTNTFVFYNANPKGKYTGDCVIRAISTAIKKPYNEVFMELVALSMKTGYCPGDRKTYGRYLAANGWIMQKQPRKSDNTKYTGREFCEEQQRCLKAKAIEDGEEICGIRISKRIIAHIGGNHIVAIVDGKVRDIWNSTGGCIGNYWIKNA